MKYEEIKKQYLTVKPNYETLGKNVVESINLLLKEAQIKVLSNTFRVKETESFLEKIDRKSYENPISETEDICGIRIICYYQKDIENITSLIKKEFKIHEFQNKEEKLEYNQFGYRSQHLIVSINPEWEKTPNFRQLSGLKCEIQIRTILMHAWAEIEHSLAYKNEIQTPQQFRRKLHRISAKLEEADEQFEELKKESTEYQKTLEKKKLDFESIDLNLDSLQAYMDSNFPKRKKDIEATGKLLNQMVEYDISLQDLNEAWMKIKPKFRELEKENFKNDHKHSKWMQVGIARFILDLYFERFRKRFTTRHLKNHREELYKKYFA